MGVHPLAVTAGLTRQQIEQSIEDAVATIAIGNGPTQILTLGYDVDRCLIEATSVIRDEDVLVVHAAPTRPEYLVLHDIAQSLPGAGDSGPPVGDAGPYGWSVDGLELSESLIVELVERAELGHDIDTLRIRIRPGRPAPLSIGDVIRLQLAPAVLAACTERADADRVAVHEVIRRALRQRLSFDDGSAPADACSR